MSKILVISFIRAIVFHFKLDFYVQNRFTDCVKHFHRHLFHKRPRFKTILPLMKCRNAADMPTNVVNITTVVDYRAQLGYQNNRERVVAH